MPKTRVSLWPNNVGPVVYNLPINSVTPKHAVMLGQKIIFIIL